MPRQRACSIFWHCMHLHGQLPDNLTFVQTHDGIDVCGERLCKELRSVVSSYPALKEISFIGHSMGGLIARYAAGAVINKEGRGG